MFYVIYPIRLTQKFIKSKWTGSAYERTCGVAALGLASNGWDGQIMSVHVGEFGWGWKSSVRGQDWLSRWIHEVQIPATSRSFCIRASRCGLQITSYTNSFVVKCRLSAKSSSSFYFTYQFAIYSEKSTSVWVAQDEWRTTNGDEHGHLSTRGINLTKNKRDEALCACAITAWVIIDYRSVVCTAIQGRRCEVQPSQW